MGSLLFDVTLIESLTVCSLRDGSREVIEVAIDVQARGAREN